MKRSCQLELIQRAALALSVVLVSTVHSEAPAEAPELSRRVEIRRTAYGIPHITGETLEAAAFGFGYCQAEDHLLNIMRSILRARGESAKFFGGEENIKSDFWNRQFRVRARAIETYHRLDADFRSMLEGFAAGMNYYVKLHQDGVPNWVPRVSGHDIAAHGLTGVARFAFNRGGIVQRFLRTKRGSSFADAPEREDLVGSNMWALAPARTRSGHAILMGNPHQPWSPVATYYEAHLTVPGLLNFYGSTFVGRPVLTTGWNDHLGWSHTVNYPDLEEIYELDLDPGRPDHYLFDGGSVHLESEVAVVEVKTQQGMESRTRTFWYCPLGPVIHRSANKVYVLKSAAYDEFRFYQQWLRLAQAKNLSEFRAALAIQAIPMFNICYADREGNIFYLWNGTVPIMPHAAHREEAVHATKSSEIWTRFHPIGELPQLLNPKGGYVQNCNSPPYLTNLHQTLSRADYPAYFPRNYVSLRSQHSLRLVHNDKRFSLEDVRDMKHSMGLMLADRVKDDLIAALTATSPRGEMKAAAQMLGRWDNTVAASSRGSVLFEIWWQRYASSGGGGFATPWTESEPTSTPRGLANKEAVARTFAAALEECKRLYGRWDVTWGEVHRIRQGKVDLAIGGGSGRLGCFRVVGFRRSDDGKLVVSGGDSWVFAVEFTNPPRAYTIVGYSESEVEGSPHASDQASLYAANAMKRAAFTEREIEAQLLKKYRPGAE